MRIRRLDLAAFGHFTGVSLDLSAPARGLHVVYGHNEAGKSTALRALRGLLYEIDERTRDDFLHAKGKLRVGACVERADGSVLEVVRRKGRKNTLLGPDGEPIDDAPLRAALGGVTEEMFVTMFGLDHDALRRGAQALLEGRGDVGESLYDAGLGGRGIHRVLEGLEREAEELYAPLGKKRHLNQAIAAYKEAQKRVRGDALTASAWKEQHEAIDAARRERDALDAQRRALFEEKVRLERQRVVIPKLLVRAQLLAQRGALGALRPVSEDAEEAHRQAARVAAESRREIVRLEGEVATLEERRDRLQIPAALVELSADAVEALAERLGAHRKAQADLPRREADLSAAEQDARRILLRAGRDVPLGEAERLRVGSDATARIGALAKAHSGLVAQRDAAREALEEREAELESVQARLASIASPADAAPLRRATDAARRDGDLEARVRQADADVAALRAEAERLLAALGLFGGSLGGAARAAAPAAETVERFAQRWDALGRERDRLRARRGELEARRRGVDEALEALETAGGVPTEEQLAEARAARDLSWRAIRARGAVHDDDAATLEDAMFRADAVADRLRREAERVTRHAALVAERSAIDGEEELRARAAQDAEEAASLFAREWRELFAPLQIGDPLPPAEMRGWLLRLDEVKRQAASLERATVDRARVGELVLAHRRAICEALAAAGEAAGGDASLGALLDRSGEVTERLRGAADARERLRRQEEELAEEVLRLARRVAARERELEGWQTQWGQSVEALGLSAGATVEEATAILGDLADLFATLDRAADLRHRIASIQAEAGSLDRDSREVARRHMREVTALPLEERIDRLVGAHRTMRAEVRHRETLEGDLAERREALAHARQREEEAAESLAALLAQAGAADLEELGLIEARSREAREIDRRVAEHERELLELGEGATVDALAEETRAVDPMQVRVRLADMDDDMEEVAEKLQAANQKLGELKNGLERLSQKSAAEAADEAESHLARVREHAHRYLRLRLASAILRQEIDRYREENQGPILSRASELFPRLTLGRYTGLKVGFDGADQAVLECVRAEDGGTVHVDGLSDGTRDQLYLALRLASVERHARHNEPLPFVVDDVLIHFDDARARAALEVLGDLAATTQVLFFTHHARLLELAREAVPAERLCAHDLDRLRAARSSQPGAGADGIT